MDRNIMRRGLSPEGREIRDRHQGSITIGVSGTALHPTQRINRKGSANHLQQNVQRLREIQANCRQRESSRPQPLKALRQGSPVLSASALKQAQNGQREFEQNSQQNKERGGSAHSDYFSMPDDHSADQEDIQRESQRSITMPDIHQNHYSEVSSRLRRQRSSEGFRSESQQGSRPSSPKVVHIQPDLKNGLTLVPNMTQHTMFNSEVPPATRQNFTQTCDLTPEMTKLRMNDILKRIKNQRPACEIDIKSHYKNIERQHRALMRGGSASLVGSISDALTHRSNLSQGDSLSYASRPGSHRLTRASSADHIGSTVRERPTHLNPLVINQSRSSQSRSSSRIHSANENRVGSRRARSSSRDRKYQNRSNEGSVLGERRLIAAQTNMPNNESSDILPFQRSKSTVGITRKPYNEDLFYAQNHSNPVSHLAKAEVSRSTAHQEQAPRRAFSKARQKSYSDYPYHVDVDEAVDFNATRTLLSPREDGSQMKKGTNEIGEPNVQYFDYQNDSASIISPRQYSPEQNIMNLDHSFVTHEQDQLSTHPSVQGLSLDASHDTLPLATGNCEDPNEGSLAVATPSGNFEEQVTSIPMSLQGPPSRSSSPMSIRQPTPRSPTPASARGSPVRLPSPVLAPVENSTPRSSSPIHGKQSASQSSSPVPRKQLGARAPSPGPTKDLPCSSKPVLSKQNKPVLKRSSSIENLRKTGQVPETYKKGELPRYLQKRKEKQRLAEEAAAAVDHNCPPGHQPLPDHERRNTLHLLKKSQAAVMRELSSLPISQDTLRVKRLNNELEAKLTQIEEGIRIFSQPKVYVMNDG